MQEKISFYLKNLNHSDDSIKGTAKFINACGAQAKEMSDIFMEEFHRSSTQNTILYFYLFHEMIFANGSNIENMVF